MNYNRPGADVIANGRSYRFPKTPTVCVCIDGSEPGYIERAIEKGLAPNFARLMRDGANLRALSVIPSFTNPNNISIITGRPPAVHGIAGNYFYDPATGQEVMMNDPKFLRAPTIMKAFYDAGAKVAVVTAKDKLRTLLGNGLDLASGRAIAFSSEKADKATLKDNGIADVPARVGMPVPDVYSSELSEFVMAAGVSILKRERPDVMYLSTTDYVQHKAATRRPPGECVLRDDGPLRRRARCCRMRAGAHRRPRHERQASAERRAGRYLSPGSVRRLARQGQGAGHPADYRPIRGAPRRARLVCDGLSAGGRRCRRTCIAKLAKLDGIDVALSREDACKRFELPPDRIGDVVVLSTVHKVLGTSRARHDLSGLTEPLRSHGGLTEQSVPMIANRKLSLPPDRKLRNFDIFDVALNYVT